MNQEVAAQFGKTSYFANLILGVQHLLITCDVESGQFGLKGYVAVEIKRTD